MYFYIEKNKNISGKIKMQILKDLSIFLHQKAKLSQFSNAYAMYRAGTDPDSDSIGDWQGLLKSQGISCVYLGRSEIKDFYLQRRVKQNFLSLEYIYSGEFYIRNGDRGYLGEAGDLFLLHSGMDHDLMFLSEKKCRKLGMILSGRMLPDLLKLFQLDHVDVIHLPDSKRLDDLFDRIRGTLQNAVSRASCEWNAAYTFGLLQMLSNVSKAEPVPAEIARILEFFESHCSEPLNIRRLASEWGMSLPTLNKRFRAALHMTPYQYLLRLRLRRAAYLLQTDEWTIKEIAEMAGYRNPLHFSSEFHRFHGCSPREFRKKLRSL